MLDIKVLASDISTILLMKKRIRYFLAGYNLFTHFPAKSEPHQKYKRRKPTAAKLSLVKNNIIFPDQEKPEFLVRQPIFSYATYFEAKPRCTLHS